MSDKIYAVFDKQENKFQTFNRKNCWMSVSALKSSYNAASREWDRTLRKWIKQELDTERYEIVELTALYEFKKNHDSYYNNWSQ